MPLVLEPLDDCWVNDSADNENANMDGYGLGIGRWVDLNRSLLKFSLVGLGISEEDIVGAELRLHGRVIKSPAKVEVLWTTNGFNEGTVTWNTQPPPTVFANEGTDVMGSTTSIPTEHAWYTVPLNAAFVRHRLGQNFMMILRGFEGAGDSYCNAESKESDEGIYPPELVIYLTGEEPNGPPDGEPSVSKKMLAIFAGLFTAFGAIVYVSRK